MMIANNKISFEAIILAVAVALLAFVPLMAAAPTASAAVNWTLPLTPNSIAPCLGAAARDPLNQPCFNSSLLFSVVPSPADVRLGKGVMTKGSICSASTDRKEGQLIICSFGVPASQAKQQVALIGDSHSLKWRTGMYQAAISRGWRVTSIGKARCPFSTTETTARTPEELRSCQQWKRELPAWLRRNPQISTAFVSGKPPTPSNAAEMARAIRGYQQQWKKLPKSVKRIIVLRDNPRTLDSTLPCIEQAMAAGKQAGLACALPRAAALDAFPDTIALAARALKKPNYGVIDLSKFYCDAKLCYPVIGGLLVNSDLDHLTPAFSATLAPFMLRALDKGRWLSR